MNKSELTKIFGAQPCAPALAWLEEVNAPKSLAEAWQVCQRGDWMWWALWHYAMPEKNVSVAFAQFCADNAGKYTVTTVARTAHAAYATYATAAAGATAAADTDEAAATYATYAAATAAIATANANADNTELKIQSDWIREHVKNPFLTEEDKNA